MSKRTVFTTISPLPPGIPRNVVVDFLHDHQEMIDLNPLVKERHPIKPPPHSEPEELHCVWYSLTDKISYLPGGLATGEVTYTCAFNDLPTGLQTHCYAPAGLTIRDKWTVNGSLLGEPREAVELGIGAPAAGLYIREDVDMRCNVFMAGFVKKTLKKSHGALVERLKEKAQIMMAKVPEGGANGATSKFGPNTLGVAAGVAAGRPMSARSVASSGGNAGVAKWQGGLVSSRPASRNTSSPPPGLSHGLGAPPGGHAPSSFAMRYQRTGSPSGGVLVAPPPYQHPTHQKQQDIAGHQPCPPYSPPVTQQQQHQHPQHPQPQQPSQPQSKQQNPYPQYEPLPSQRKKSPQPQPYHNRAPSHSPDSQTQPKPQPSLHRTPTPPREGRDLVPEPLRIPGSRGSSPGRGWHEIPKAAAADREEEQRLDRRGVQSPPMNLHGDGNKVQELEAPGHRVQVQVQVDSPVQMGATLRGPFVFELQ